MAITLPRKIGKKINKIFSKMFNNNKIIKKLFKLHIRNIEIINLIATILIILLTKLSEMIMNYNKIKMFIEMTRKIKIS
jgi:hypothetical protein